MKKTRRLISILLATVMLISLLPTFTASAAVTNTNKKLRYAIQGGGAYYNNVTAPYYGTTDATRAKLNTFTDYAKTCGFWRWADVQGTSLGASSQTNGSFFELRAAQGEWTALEINVPVAGTYNVELVSYASKSAPKGCRFAYVILPASYTASQVTEHISEVSWNKTTNMLEGADKVFGQINCDTADYTASTSNTDIEQNVNFPTAGKYLVVFKNIENGTNGVINNAIVFTSVELKNGSANTYAPMGTTILTKTNFEEVGETAVASASAVYKSDARNEYTASAVTYVSSDERVVSVSGTDVTAVGYGRATVTAIVDGYPLVPVEVTAYKNGEPPRLDKVTIAPANDIVAVGRETTVNISEILDSYEGNYTSDYSVEFEIEDASEAAKVELSDGMDKNSCKIKALAVGEVTIKATVTPKNPVDNEEAAKVATAKITITEAPYLSKLEILTANTGIFAGDTEKVDVKLTMSDNLPAFEDADYEFTWSSSDEDVLTVDGTTKKITAGAEGEADLTVFARNEKGETVTSEAVKIKVSTAPKTVLIDFGKSVCEKVDGNWQLTSTPGYELVPGKITGTRTVRTLSDGVKCVEVNVGKQYDNECWPGSTSAMNLFTIKIEIPKNGYYAVDFMGGTSDVGTAYAIYVDGKDYLGDYDTYNKDASYSNGGMVSGENKSLNTVYLTKGSHEISWRAIKGYDGLAMQSRLFLAKLQFTRLEEATALPTFEQFEASKTEFIATEKETIALRVKMSDGSYYSFGRDGDGALGVVPGSDADDVITVTAGNDKVEVDAANIVKNKKGHSDKIYIPITPKTMGESSITVSGKIRGEEIAPQTIPLNVLDASRLAEVRLSVEKSKFAVGRETTVSAKLFDSYGKVYGREYNLTFEVENEEEAERVNLTADGNTCTLHGVSAGTVSLKVTATPVNPVDDLEIPVSKTISITVDQIPYLLNVSVIADRNAMKVGEKETLRVGLTMNDGLAPIGEAEYEYTWEIDDTSVLTIDEETMTVTALSEGTAGIWVSTVNELGQTLRSEVFELKVVDVISSDMESGVVIDFGKSKSESIDGIWVLTEHPGYEIVKDKSSGTFTVKTGSDGIKRLENNIGKQTDENCWPYNTTRANMFTIAVDIPKDAYYAVYFTGGRTSIGNVFAIYVDGKEYLGDYNFFEEGAPKDTPNDGGIKQLNTVYLTKGTHEISWRAIKGYYDRPSQSRVLPGKLQFFPLGISEKPEFSSVETEIADIVPGEEIECAAKIRMTDDSYYHFGLVGDGNVGAKNPTTYNGSITVTTDSENIEIPSASVVWDEKGNSGIIRYTVRALSGGIGEIKFAGEIDGVPFEAVEDVSVSTASLASAKISIANKMLLVGDEAELSVSAALDNGNVLSSSAGEVEFSTSNDLVASVDGNTLRAEGAGNARISVSVSLGGVTVTDYVDVVVFDSDLRDVVATAGGSKYIRLTDDANDTVPMFVAGVLADGTEVDLTGVDFEYTALTPEYAEISATGEIFPKKVGEASFKISGVIGGTEREFEVSLLVVLGKYDSIIYTPEIREATLENADTYQWAESSANSNAKKADPVVKNLDAYYEAFASEGLPRAIYTGAPSDPKRYTCHYCGADLAKLVGVSYYFSVDPIKEPWKIKCPACSRVFPSNDFESFYELGLNEYGEFDRIRALEAHRAMLIEKGLMSEEAIAMQPGDQGEDISKQEEIKDPTDWYTYYGYGVEGGYLHNDLYPEVGNTSCPVVLQPGENPAIWGADDGWGYRTGYSGYTDAGKWQYDEHHNYIGFYRHSVNFKLFDLIKATSFAYLYTGKVEYGRACAILLDRLADFYPDYDLRPYGHFTDADHGGRKTGNLFGCIVEAQAGPAWAKAYDSVFELYEDEFVINFIQEKNKKYKMRHAKETPSQIRTNVEDGLLREVLNGMNDMSVFGNFGYPQGTVASVAVALDTDPDTTYWLNWLTQPGYVYGNVVPKGGSMNDYIIDNVDHDGQGNEGSIYNVQWTNYMTAAQEYIDYYIAKYGEEKSVINLFDSPKYVSMLYANLPLTMSNYTPNIGDAQRTALNNRGWEEASTSIKTYKSTGDEMFLQYAYTILNGNTNNLHYDIHTENPEAIKKEAERVVAERGYFNLPSYMMTGFGFAALRDGAVNGGYVGGEAKNDTRRGMWMYFGSSIGHGHAGSLNLGLDAFGHDYFPDLGYPIMADRDPNGMEWTNNTLSHNAVAVRVKSATDPVTGEKYSTPQDNAAAQQKESTVRGKSLHFDDAGMVKVMDVDAADVYDATDIYRRSLVMVNIDDDNFYGLDFFRVLGGDVHEFSLHAQSDNVKAVSGLGEVTPQVDENGNYIGSYAGADVPYGPDPYYEYKYYYPTKYPKGYTWLDYVDRYNNLESSTISFDYEMDDFIKKLSDPKGLHLRATMLGINTEDTKVAFANGYPAALEGNADITNFRYVLVKREGEDLDTLFTTVYEPYRTNRTISDITELPLTIKGGREIDTDVARAVKVALANGRVDYVFYATNNDVTYTITDGEFTLDFRGFAGVYSVVDGVNTYKYICDGDILGEAGSSEIGIKTAVTGRIIDFTKELAFDNYITIKLDDVNDAAYADELVGRYMFIENDGLLNASYRIGGVTVNGDEMQLYLSNKLERDGAEYDFGSPTLIRTLVDKYDLEGGYVYNVAKRQNVVIPLSYGDENAPVFEAVSDGRVSVGSMYTQVVSAEGHNGIPVMITGRDLPRGASFDSETNTFSWKPTMTQLGTNHVSLTARDEFGRETTVHFIVEVYGSVSGGGGGGGDVPPTVEPDEPTVEPENPTVDPDEPGTGTPSETKGFVDLGNHAWAEDAINVLAEAGIIKGTSESTFAPANNITRADFAILLVRAFKLESEETENFEDVSDTDYFARELAVARNTGLVGGIGDNKYAPRNTITRQDMMLILYRALVKMGIELKPIDGIDVTSFADFEDVADYAKEAVKALVEAGLVNGKGDKLAGADFTTRAEVAVLLKRVLDYIEAK